MASQSSLLAFGAVMEDVVVLSATSSESGFPKENAIDFNLDLAWHPTSTANQTFVLDLGSARTVNRMAICLKNYLTDLSAMTIDLESSTDNANWTSRITAAPVVNGYHWIVAATQSDISARYWRVTFKTMAAIPYVAAIYLGFNRDIAIGNQKPEITETVYLNELSETYSARIYAAGIARDAVRKANRIYLFPLPTYNTALKAAFDDSFGRRFPLLYLEGTSAADWYLGRFDSDIYRQIETGFGIHEPNITIVEEQYIRDGKNY